MSNKREYSLYDKLNFGKYKGHHIEEVIEDDPGYIEWCLDNIDDFELDDSAADYLEEVISGTDQDDTPWGA